MKPVSSDTLTRQLNWRYATKKFDPTKEISEADWLALEHTLVLTPSSFGLQPWKFIVITNQEVKEKLVPLSWGQRQVADASHTVVLAIRQKLDEQEIVRHVNRTAEVRGVEHSALEKYKKSMVNVLLHPAQHATIDEWATRQVYIALGSFMTAAAVIGVDTCPMEGIQPKKYDEVLGLTGTGYATVLACPAGYRAPDDKYAVTPKVRFKHEDVVIRI
jgi:nitroreductase